MTPTKKSKWPIGCLLAILAIGSFGYCTYRGFVEAHTVRTGTDAGPQDVTFLRLPATASHISYWRDGINYLAEFDIPEEAFRKLFKEFQFHELSEPITVTPGVFGNPDFFPGFSQLDPVSIASGLKYDSGMWSGGGSNVIIYDRTRSRAYYSYASR